MNWAIAKTKPPTTAAGHVWRTPRIPSTMPTRISGTNRASSGVWRPTIAPRSSLGIPVISPSVMIGIAIAQFACSNYVSVELTDIVASLLATGAIVALLQVWQPSEPIVGERFTRGPAIAGAAVADPVFEAEVRRKDDEHRDTRGEIMGAYAPYLIIIAVFALAQLGPIKTFLENAGTEFGWPGLDVTNGDGEAVKATTFKLNWLNAAGTLLLISGLLTMLAQRVSPGRTIGAAAVGLGGREGELCSAGASRSC